MTFNQVVWKMAKYHYKKYIFYLACNSVAVMFFFTFMTLYFNEYLVSVKQSEGIQYLLSIPGAALIFFTVFFISYAHHIFMKKRRSEFGLFMTLGMTNRDISKLLLLENIVIAIMALIIGLVTGTIFSKLLFWLLLKSVGIQDFSYHINAKMFIYAIGAFFIVFIVAVGQSLYVTMKRNIIDNLKTENVTENMSNKDPVIGGIGVIIVISSIIGLYYTYRSPLGGDLLLLWTMATLLGLAIALNQLTSFIIDLIKKNKKLYYRNMLYLTNIDYKYKQFTSIMLLVTSMIMVTLIYSTIIFHMYTSIEKEVIEYNPYDVAYIQTESKNNISSDEVYSIFAEHGNKVQEQISFPIYFYFHKEFDGYMKTMNFMPISEFNKIMNSKYELQDDEFIYYWNDEADIDEMTPYDRGLRLTIDNDEVIYQLNEKVFERKFNNLQNVYDIFILNDAQFTMIRNSREGIELTAQFINIENWQESDEAINSLEQAFNRYNASTSIINISHIILEDELFRINSRVDGYKSNKNSYGILFFVTIFLSILFFIGSFLLMYIQLFSEMDKEEERIHKLYSIGITSEEVKKLVSQEITTIFMLPTLLGIIIALFYIIGMATDIGGVIKNPILLLQFLMLATIYILIQFLFLLYAKKRMYLQLISHK